MVALCMFLNTCYFSVKHCLMHLSEDTQCLSTGAGSLDPFVQPVRSEVEKHPALESPPARLQALALSREPAH